MSNVVGKKRKQLDSPPTQKDTKKRKTTQINGYHVLPIKIYNSPFLKYLFYKEHKEKDHTKDIEKNLKDTKDIEKNSKDTKDTEKNRVNEDSDHVFEKDQDLQENEKQKDKGRTLFVTNLAFDCTSDDLESIFSVFGPISSITLSSLKIHDTEKPKRQIEMGTPNTNQKIIMEEKKRKEEEMKKEEELKRPFSAAGFAHVTFETRESLKKALKGAKPLLDSKEDDQPLFEQGSTKGIQKWKKSHLDAYVKDMTKLQQEVDQYMWLFDKDKLEAKKKVENLISVPDDDGWVTVTRKGNNKNTVGANGKTVGIAKLDQETKKKILEKEKAKHKDDFYRFQRSQNKTNYITQLRMRFEEDKKRIDSMKAARKFKPF